MLLRTPALDRKKKTTNSKGRDIADFSKYSSTLLFEWTRETLKSCSHKAVHSGRTRLTLPVMTGIRVINVPVNKVVLYYIMSTCYNAYDT